MTPSTTLLIGAVAMTASIAGAIEWRSRSHVTTLAFWFDPTVTFEVYDPARFGEPLSIAEQQRIREVAQAEVEHAFADYRVRVVGEATGMFQVSVQQLLRGSGRAAGWGGGAAGQSHVFGPLGGRGAVSFYLLAAQAMAHAPEGAARADIVDAIGRGIGRAAVHEFAHQILPQGPMHSSQDAASYEYWTSNRPAQYYGDMHWSVARERLAARLR